MARIRKSQRQAETTRQALWNTAIYIRLSREDGNDESYSVTNQKQRLMAYFELIAAEESMQLIDVYVDDGFTGTDSKRDDFQRMLGDLDDGKINCIIVKDLSRLSRNDWECKRYLQHLFVVKDVRFISLELPRLDSYARPDEIYDLGVTMQSAYNENHCRETSIKVRGTLNAKRRVVKGQCALRRGRPEVRGLVLNVSVVCEREEPMGEARRHPERAGYPRIEGHVQAPAETWRRASQVDDDIEDLSHQHPNELAL